MELFLGSVLGIIGSIIVLWYTPWLEGVYRRASYRVRRRFSRERRIEQLARSLNELLNVDPVTRCVMEFAEHRTPLAVDVLALVNINQTLDEVRARWQLLARYGQVELRRLEQVEWTVAALAPVLAGHDVTIGDFQIRHDEWNITSRIRILTALFHRYGVRKTLSDLDSWREKHPTLAAARSPIRAAVEP